MNRHTLILSAVVLSAVSFTASADVKSDAERQVALHTAMGAQARASKDFGTAAHCAQLVRENGAIAAQAGTAGTSPADHEALAVAAERQAAAHEAMLRTANFSRTPGMAAHCRTLISQYRAEAAAQRELAKTSR